MIGSRTATALVGLGLAVSVGAWIAFGTLVLFLLLPFVPFLFAGRDDARTGDREPSGLPGSKGTND